MVRGSQGVGGLNQPRQVMVGGGLSHVSLGGAGPVWWGGGWKGALAVAQGGDHPATLTASLRPGEVRGHYLLQG